MPSFVFVFFVVFESHSNGTQEKYSKSNSSILVKIISMKLHSHAYMYILYRYTQSISHTTRSCEMASTTPETMKNVFVSTTSMSLIIKNILLHTCLYSILYACINLSDRIYAQVAYRLVVLTEQDEQMYMGKRYVAINFSFLVVEFE